VATPLKVDYVDKRFSCWRAILRQPREYIVSSPNISETLVRYVLVSSTHAAAAKGTRRPCGPATTALPCYYRYYTTGYYTTGSGSAGEGQVYWLDFKNQNEFVFSVDHSGKVSSSPIQHSQAEKKTSTTQENQSYLDASTQSGAHGQLPVFLFSGRLQHTRPPAVARSRSALSWEASVGGAAI